MVSCAGRSMEPMILARLRARSILDSVNCYGSWRVSSAGC